MAWTAASRGLIERRAERGCLLPTLADATAAAALALQEATEPFCGRPLFGAERAAALLAVRSNAVPEALVLSDSAKDADDAYRLEYDRAAARVLAGARLSKDAVWRAIIGSYWKYLKASSGADVNIDDPAGGAAAEAAPLTNVMLFAPTYARRASRSPFKHRQDNAAYKALAAELRGALRAVEKYVYYMRPADPMVASPDTEVRLQEVLAYAATAYRWLLWFMDALDGTVLRKLGKRASGAVGPREPRPPGELYERHLTSGPAAACGSGAALMLSALTAAALDLLLRVGAAWTGSSWKSNTQGVTGAIVAAVELASGLHHHLQYLLNMVFVGYVCWLRAGLRDPYMISAIRAQCRFAHFTGRLMPTMTSASWAALERGTAGWFKLALLRSVAAHGAPTRYYEDIVESVQLGAGRGLLSPARPRRSRRAARPLPRPPSPAPAAADSDSDAEGLGFEPAVGVYASMHNLEGVYANTGGPLSPAAAATATTYENEGEDGAAAPPARPPAPEPPRGEAADEAAEGEFEFFGYDSDGPLDVDGPVPAPMPRCWMPGGRGRRRALHYAELRLSSSDDDDEEDGAAGAAAATETETETETEAAAAAPPARRRSPRAADPCTERPGNPARSYSRSRPRLRALDDRFGLASLAAAGAAHTARHNREVWQRFSRDLDGSEDDEDDAPRASSASPSAARPARGPAAVEMLTSL
ncbi:tegument protein VP11/12 [Cervid alphaherpesvirus 2]|uniref:Tegument protein UL46 homolog n=1 Tax=Cervid alphaherpesvirus 2 TaxID=365327 RepID=A0A455JNA4_9ALPH|nr:tegument protein VP11/12 [Cervid alphaherpesvirus 2]AVT50734.1 tegument protein VP11/12 [Cervid alphaherpesvirus 2]